MGFSSNKRFLWLRCRSTGINDKDSIHNNAHKVTAQISRSSCPTRHTWRPHRLLYFCHCTYVDRGLYIARSIRCPMICTVRLQRLRIVMLARWYQTIRLKIAMALSWMCSLHYLFTSEHCAIVLWSTIGSGAEERFQLWSVTDSGTRGVISRLPRWSPYQDGHDFVYVAQIARLWGGYINFSFHSFDKIKHLFLYRTVSPFLSFVSYHLLIGSPKGYD
jgi:hypothetical protein